jgi:hypothetical protein
LLPLERTGIYFVPISMLLVALSITTFEAGRVQSFLRSAGTLALLLVVLYFVSALRTDHFRGREYDARSKDVYLALRSLDVQRNSEIGINWLLEPSLNFYRTYYSDSYIPAFTRQEPDGSEKFFVLLPDSSDADLRFIQEHDIRITYREPSSGAIVGVSN